MKQNIVWIIVIVVLVAFSLPGCQANTDPVIKVEDIWGRPSSQETVMEAFYMVVKNQTSTEDALLGASSAACGAIELHESFMSIDNVMGMRPVEGGKIDIPAKGQMELKPGGLHVMCINKIGAFNVGDKIPLALKFAQTGEMPVDLEIRQP